VIERLKFPEDSDFIGPFGMNMVESKINELVEASNRQEEKMYQLAGLVIDGGEIDTKELISSILNGHADLPAKE
jgi:hypothetical protein